MNRTSTRPRKTLIGYFVRGKRQEYGDIEAAISAAKRLAKHEGSSQLVDFLGNALCTVTPDGHVDMTWEGGSVISSTETVGISISEKRLL